ncbi:mandelate racemase/muconate lactonizing enzyme family protein [Rhodovibrionaceae bacterium A322]
MSGTKIVDVEAKWLRYPIPKENQHVSDFGLIDAFDMTLVTITLGNGRKGYGEAKAGVGSMGSCDALVQIIERELKPQLLGLESGQINRIWNQLYNGSRDHYGESQGRAFPILGRRGLWTSAMSGIDLALWDLAGKRFDAPVLELIGGPARSSMQAYASGGWADVSAIGAQLQSYVDRGFKAVKMRIGVMDGTVSASVARVKAAREALGEDIEIMVDAHGTYNGAEAREFCRRVADCNVRWFEEPVSADSRKAMSLVKQSATMPISMGESEFTSFDFMDLIDRDAADVLQPDMAICGGLSEGMKISSLAVANQLELAPHCWGSAFSFMAGLTLAFFSPAAKVIEFSSGANPMLSDLVKESIQAVNGSFTPPQGAGWGLTVNQDFVRDYAV